MEMALNLKTSTALKNPKIVFLNNSKHINAGGGISTTSKCPNSIMFTLRIIRPTAYLYPPKKTFGV